MRRHSWAPIVLLLIGVWLMASPFVLHYSAMRPSAVFEDFVPGILLVVTAGWALAARTAPVFAEWIQALCGVWLVLGSFVLLFSRVTPASLNHLVIGFVVVLISLMGISALVRQPGAAA
jgi:hypothetical protein